MKNKQKIKNKNLFYLQYMPQILKSNKDRKVSQVWGREGLNFIL